MRPPVAAGPIDRNLSESNGDWADAVVASAMRISARRTEWLRKWQSLVEGSTEYAASLFEEASDLPIEKQFCRFARDDTRSGVEQRVGDGRDLVGLPPRIGQLGQLAL